MGVFLRSKGRTRHLRDGRFPGAKMKRVGDGAPVYFEHLSPGAFRHSHEFEVVDADAAEVEQARQREVGAHLEAEAAASKEAEDLRARVGELEAAAASAVEAAEAQAIAIAKLRAQVTAGQEREEGLRQRIAELEAIVDNMPPDVGDAEGDDAPDGDDAAEGAAPDVGHASPPPERPRGRAQRNRK